MSLGPITFEIAPLNAHAVTRTHSAEFAEKPVAGIRPPLEWTGEGGETINLTGRVFPRKTGGLGELERLDEARIAGKPLYLMRGDGRPMGWFVIESVTERATYLDARGVGQVIDFDLTLRRSERPEDGAFHAVMPRL